MLKKTYTLTLTQDQFNRLFDLVVDQRIVVSDMIQDEVADNLEDREDLVNEVADLEDIEAQLTKEEK